MADRPSSLKRLVVVGDANCGKTSLIHALTDGKFKTDVLPTVFDHHTIVINIENSQVYISLRVGAYIFVGV